MTLINNNNPLSCGVHSMELKAAVKAVDAIYDDSLSSVFLELSGDEKLNIIANAHGRAWKKIETLYPAEGVIEGKGVCVSRHGLLVAIDALAVSSLTLRGLACGGVRLITLARDFIDVPAAAAA